MSFLLASHVDKNFHDRNLTIPVLKDLSFDVKESEIISLIGPSGCGKTTLLRIIAGLLRPTEGVIHIGGETPENYRKSGKIGFVFQKPTLFPWRTVVENVLLPAELRNNSRSIEARKNAQNLLHLFGLDGFENIYPRQLSGGMLQRTAVARALMSQPHLLLLDEPFSSLDEVTRENLWLDFKEIWREQRLTVLLVTHSIREAVYFSNRVLILSFRPSYVADEIYVELPTQRNRDVIDSSDFIAICEKIRKKIAWS
jgi:NitT/TauT family transport system ATP-binding protein